MTIGVLREGEGENRVVLLPEHVVSLAKKSIEVLMEKDAGVLSFAKDQEYTDAGAKVGSRAEVIKNSDVIFSIQGPSDKIPEGKVLISIFSPLSNKPMVDHLLKTGVTSYSLDMIPRSTRAQAVDVLSSMATVAGQ